MGQPKDTSLEMVEQSMEDKEEVDEEEEEEKEKTKTGNQENDEEETDKSKAANKALTVKHLAKNITSKKKTGWVVLAYKEQVRAFTAFFFFFSDCPEIRGNISFILCSVS